MKAPTTPEPRPPARGPRLTLRLVLLAGLGTFAVVVLAPAYQSPSSRVYASALGYPALMRLFGRPIPVEAEPVRERAMLQVIAAEGETAHLNEIPIFSDVPGVVAELMVEEGQKKQRGDILLRINPGATRPSCSACASSLPIGSAARPSSSSCARRRCSTRS